MSRSSMESETDMTDELQLALAYWRTMTPQPKALVYIEAIEARLSGEATDSMVVDHELTNAITRGASIARGQGIKVKGSETTAPAAASPKQEDKPKAKTGRKGKVG